MKKTMYLLIILLTGLHSLAQLKIKTWPAQGWLESFMTGGANASTFRHFLLLPEGTIQIFAPGEKPQPFAGIDHVVSISAGTFHMLALKEDGTVWAWGGNSDRQLGNELLAKNEKGSDIPVEVSKIKNAVAISAKGLCSYALLKDSTVWAWGYGNSGMTGDGEKLTGPLTSSHWSGRPVPVQVKGIHNAIAISGPMALLANGTVMSWGDGYHGRLGNGADTTSNLPVTVRGLSNAVAIAYREYGALALLENGTVWAWGSNIKGQLGTGSNAAGDNKESNIPVRVQGIGNAVSIDAHTICLALLKDGHVKVWGWGAVGGMGFGAAGSNDINGTAMNVPLAGYTKLVKAGNGYGFALQDDGTLFGWGANMVTKGIYHQTWTPVKITSIKIP